MLDSITENVDEEAVKAYIRLAAEGVRLNHMSVIIAAYYGRCWIIQS